MMFKELKSKIKMLSDMYSVVSENGHTVIRYKNKVAFYITNEDQFIFANNIRESMPFSHKAYMLVAEYAATPVDERHANLKYYLTLTKTYPNYSTNTDGDINETYSVERCERLQLTQEQIDQMNNLFTFDLNDVRVEIEEA